MQTRVIWRGGSIGEEDRRLKEEQGGGCLRKKMENKNTISFVQETRLASVGMLLCHGRWCLGDQISAVWVSSGGRVQGISAFLYLGKGYLHSEMLMSKMTQYVLRKYRELILTS